MHIHQIFDFTVTLLSDIFELILWKCCSSQTNFKNKNFSYRKRYSWKSITAFFMLNSIAIFFFLLYNFFSLWVTSRNTLLLFCYLLNILIGHRLIINQIVSAKKQIVQESRFVVEVSIVPSMCENTEEVNVKSRQCPALQNAVAHYCIFSVWSRTFVKPPNDLIVKIISCSQD